MMRPYKDPISKMMKLIKRMTLWKYQLRRRGRIWLILWRRSRLLKLSNSRKKRPRWFWNQKRSLTNLSKLLNHHKAKVKVNHISSSKSPSTQKSTTILSPPFHNKLRSSKPKSKNLDQKTISHSTKRSGKS